QRARRQLGHHEVADRAHEDISAADRIGARRERWTIQALDRSHELLRDGGYDLDLQAEVRFELFDQGHLRWVVHGDDQNLAEAEQWHDQVPGRELLGNDTGKLLVDGDLVEVEEVHVQLRAQRVSHRDLVDVAERDERLAQGHALAPLVGERLLELRRSDASGLDEDRAQPRALAVPRQHRVELLARDELFGEQHLAEWHVGARHRLQPQRDVELLFRDHAVGDEQLAETASRGRFGGDGGRGLETHWIRVDGRWLAHERSRHMSDRPTHDRQLN